MRCFSRYPVIVVFALLFQGNTTFAFQSAANSPKLAYFVDNGSRSIRVLRGFSGAAVAGDSIVTEVEFGTVAPDGRAAIVSRGGQLSWVRNLAEPQMTEPLPGMDLRADAAVWSASGLCAALFSMDSARVQQVCDTPAGLVVSPPHSFSGRVLRAVALDRTGSRMAVSGTDHDGNSFLYLITPNGTQFLNSSSSASALAFRRSGSILGTFEDGSLVEWQAPDFSSTVIRSAEGSVLEASVIAESASGEVLVLVENGKAILLFSDAVAPRRHLLDDAVSGLQHVRSGEYVATASQGGGSMMLIDVNRSETVFFIPEADSNE